MAKRRRKERRENRKAKREEARQYARKRFDHYIDEGFSADAAGAMALDDTRAGFDLSGFLALILAFIEGLIDLFDD